MNVVAWIKNTLSRGRRGSRVPRRLNHIAQLQLLEDRVLLDGMSLVGQFDNGTALYSDGWGESNYAYIGHYANNNGMQIIDISDPTNPTLASTFLSASGWNDFRDMEVTQQGDRTIAFCSSDTGGGVIVVDVTDRTAPVELYRITSADGGTNTVHTLSVDGDFLYEADSRTPNIRVFDISVPEQPAFLRIIHSDSNGPVHEVTALNGRLYTAVIDSVGASEVYDISNVGDPNTPVTLISSIPSGSSAHTAWPTDDGNIVAVARETAGGDVRLWDISDPSTPVLASTISLPRSETYSLHQVMIDGNLLYISAYQAGVLVYDITDPTAPVQVGSYKTNDLQPPFNGYDGCWGVFPFLGQDRILAFDMRTGLSVLSLDGMSSAANKAHHGKLSHNSANALTSQERTLVLASTNHGVADAVPDVWSDGGRVSAPLELPILMTQQQTIVSAIDSVPTVVSEMHSNHWDSGTIVDTAFIPGDLDVMESL
jgi:hypothetical protein